MLSFIVPETRLPLEIRRPALEDAAVRAGHKYEKGMEIPDEVAVGAVEADLNRSYKTVVRDDQDSGLLARWTLGS